MRIVEATVLLKKFTKGVHESRGDRTREWKGKEGDDVNFGRGGSHGSNKLLSL